MLNEKNLSSSLNGCLGDMQIAVVVCLIHVWEEVNCINHCSQENLTLPHQRLQLRKYITFRQVLIPRKAFRFVIQRSRRYSSTHPPFLFTIATDKKSFLHNIETYLARVGEVVRGLLLERWANDE